MRLVLDTSVAVEWFLVGHHLEKAREVAALLRDGSCVVPGLWPLEVANVFGLAVRRNRMTRAARDAALQALADLSIEVDGETWARAWTTTTDLADRHRLTIYDATYLDLAVRRQLPIATFDEAIIRGARAEGIEVVPTAASAS